MEQSSLAKYLNLTVLELESFDLDVTQLREDTGSSGDFLYSYYFEVPNNTPQSVLDKKGWTIGDRIEVPLQVFDQPGNG